MANCSMHKAVNRNIIISLKLSFKAWTSLDILPEAASFPRGEPTEAVADGAERDLVQAKRVEHVL